MMKEAMEGSEDGIKVGGQLITDIRFADDQGMVDNTEVGLQRTMDRLNKTAKEYDLKINVKKTKTMVVSKKGVKINIKVNGKKLNRLYNLSILKRYCLRMEGA